MERIELNCGRVLTRYSSFLEIMVLPCMDSTASGNDSETWAKLGHAITCLKIPSSWKVYRDYYRGEEVEEYVRLALAVCLLDEIGELPELES